MLTISLSKAVVGPILRDPPESEPVAPTPPPAPKPKVTPKPEPVSQAKSEPKPEATTEPKYRSVDQIKGLGQFKFGAHVKDFPPELLRIIDPKAKGVLLRVSPYGDNYLVSDLKNLTWGTIPLAGLIVTFHDDSLIDLQMALKAKKVDLYVADRAFKDKYGPSDAKTLPVETWDGDDIEVTLIFIGTNFADPNSLDGHAQGKVEFFDKSQWKKIETAKNAKLKAVLDKTYEEAAKKAKANL